MRGRQQKEENGKRTGRSTWKKTLAIVLAAGVMTGLAGCGSKGEANQSEEANTTSGQVQTERNYYSGEYTSIPEEGWISAAAISDSEVFYSAYDEKSGMAFRKYDMESGQVADVPLEMTENESIDMLTVNSAGNIVAVKTDWSAGDGSGSNPLYTLMELKSDGTVVREKDLSGLLEQSVDLPYIYYLAVGKDDAICVSNGNTVWALDKEGNPLFQVSADNWVQGIGTMNDGSVAVSGYEGDKLAVKTIDFDKKDWGKTYKNEIINESTDIKFVKGGKENEFYFYNSSAMYLYNTETDTVETVMNWLTNDVLSDNLSLVSVADDGKIRMFSSDSTGSGTGCELAELSKTETKEAAEKQIITLGTSSLSTDLRQSVIDFNKKSDKYRVEVINYGEGSETEYSGIENSEGMTRLKNEIVAGNIPDLINITDGSETFYAAKGILEDLKPYVDGENGLNREEYFDNILTAMEDNGKLYVLAPDFAINTIAGKTSEVGEGYNWTMDEMMKLAEKRAEGVEVFDHETKQSALKNCLYYNMEQFFDLSEGHCDFDNEEFKKVLEFANMFPESNEYADTDPSQALLISEGRLMLCEATLCNARSYQMYHNMYGEDISLIGYPTKNECGSAVSCGDIGLAISAKSENKEGAWEFIRFLMSEEYQKNSTSWFPMMKSAFEMKMSEEMEKQYATDENGKQAEISTYMVSWQDYTMELYAATEEEVAAVRELVEKIDHTVKNDEQIYNIVTEEAAAYFGGQKSVDEVVDVIQNRAGIYMNENK